MFEQVFVVEAPSNKRFWAACAGVTGQAALVASMILAPLVWPEALPRPASLLTLLLPPVPAPPPPKAPDLPRVTQRTVATHSLLNPDGTINIPRTIPKFIPIIVDETPPAPAGIGVAGGTGVPGSIGVPGAISNLFSNTVLAPPPPVTVAKPVEKPAESIEPKRLKIGGLVLQGKLVSRVEPQYPALARQMRVSGVVELVAIVGTDGRIKELRVLSGHPLLTAAAAEAVKHWIYRPTFLDGEAVEVTAPVTVTFKMN